MLTFLRRIRKSLIESGSARKYLLYAIGEIALVVIGILIALSINNWNEWGKDRDKEKKVLIELKKSLERNCDEMKKDAIRREEWNRSSDIIISVLQGDSNYSDSLNIHFQDARKPGTNLSLSSAGYEGLKNAGFDIIRPDVLRNGIIELFEVSQKKLIEEMEYFESFQPDRQKYLDQTFMYEDDKFNAQHPFAVPIKPHNFNSLKKDITFLSMIKSVKVQRNVIGTILIQNLNESQKVLQLIEDELDDLE